MSRYVTLRYGTLRYGTFRYVTRSYVTFRYVPLRGFVTFRTLCYVSIHDMTLFFSVNETNIKDETQFRGDPRAPEKMVECARNCADAATIKLPSGTNNSRNHAILQRWNTVDMQPVHRTLFEKKVGHVWPQAPTEISLKKSAGR